MKCWKHLNCSQLVRINSLSQGGWSWYWENVFIKLFMKMKLSWWWGKVDRINEDCTLEWANIILFTEFLQIMGSVPAPACWLSSHCYSCNGLRGHSTQQASTKLELNWKNRKNRMKFKLNYVHLHDIYDWMYISQSRVSPLIHHWTLRSIAVLKSIFCINFTKIHWTVVKLLVGALFKLLNFLKFLGNRSPIRCNEILNLWEILHFTIRLWRTV